ncbi:hypothetical protein FB451DRAFT_1234590, partial [Mycena latifolia]
MTTSQATRKQRRSTALPWTSTSMPKRTKNRQGSARRRRSRFAASSRGAPSFSLLPHPRPSRPRPRRCRLWWPRRCPRANARSIPHPHTTVPGPSEEAQARRCARHATAPLGARGRFGYMHSEREKVVMRGGQPVAQRWRMRWRLLRRDWSCRPPLTKPSHEWPPLGQSTLPSRAPTPCGSLRPGPRLARGVWARAARLPRPLRYAKRGVGRQWAPRRRARRRIRIVASPCWGCDGRGTKAARIARRLQHLFFRHLASRARACPLPPSSSSSSIS